MKNTIPKTLSDKEEEWRQWKEDVMDFLDSQNPGMKEFLEQIAERKEDGINEQWILQMKSVTSPKVWTDRINLWRALKGLTEGEARKVVNAVRDEDGFIAWMKLHHRFEPGLATQEGVVMAEFSAMVKRPAKNPTETKGLVTEMDRKMKRVYEVTREDISQAHAKSVLIGILDPLTRQHTAMSHGTKTTFEELKKRVMEFANNTMAPDAMTLGAVGQCGGDLLEPGAE